MRLQVKPSFLAPLGSRAMRFADVIYHVPYGHPAEICNEGLAHEMADS